MYHVSQAVIYTAMRETGESFYWTKADIKRRKERENEKRRERKTYLNE